MTEIDFALLAGQGEATSRHPAADGAVGLFGGSIIAIGKGAGLHHRRQVFQVIETAARRLTANFGEGFGLKKIKTDGEVELTLEFVIGQQSAGKYCGLRQLRSEYEAANRQRH